MNEEILQQQDNIEFITNQTKQFFKLNLENDVDLQTNWDAYKTVIRGNMIMLNTKHRKNEEKKT